MRRLLVLTALFALPLSANWFEVSPPAPTAATPVTITFISDPLGICGPNKAEVTVLGTNIHVRMSAEGGGCGADVNPRILSVAIGTLPVGEYALNAEYANERWRGKFVVRNTVGQLAAVSMLGGTPVTLLFAREGDEVRFGGTLALYPRLEAGGLVVTAPPHEPGLYDITVKQTSGTVTVPGGIYFFDPSAPPDLTVFERVLFPVLDTTSGAFRSRWTATATIENPSYAYVETFNRIDHVMCVDRPCMEVRPPQTTFDVEGSGFPDGAVLYVPRPAPLTFGLRVKEISRSDDPGVEIVPVREWRFVRQGGVILVNVPLFGDYRTKIRIYAIEPVPLPYVSVTVRSDDPAVAWTGIVVPLRRSDDLTVPARADLDMDAIFKGREGNATRATVSIYGAFNPPLWAFASAVHNSSQRMLIITPQ